MVLDRVELGAAALARKRPGQQLGEAGAGLAVLHAAEHEAEVGPLAEDVGDLAHLVGAAVLVDRYVVEIAQRSLTDDRTVMARVYAASGIPIYWIINLIDGQVEVYSDPDQTSSMYSAHVDYEPGDTVPVIIEGRELARIAVADLLP